MKLKNFSLAYGAQVYKACSDESRLRILHLIFRNKEMCVSDLEMVLEFTQAKTSRHVNYLKNSGILGFRKADQWVFYHIKEEVFEIVQQILDFLSKDQKLRQDQETYKALYTNRELSINKKLQKNWVVS